MTEEHQSGTTPGAVTGYEDPAGVAPWAMQLVVRAEKAALPNTTTAAAATAFATVTLLGSEEAAGDWAPAIERWEAGRIRKIVRRARGAAWEKVQCLPGVSVQRHGCEVRAFVPGPTDQVAPELRRLQVEGFSLAHEARDLPERFGGLLIALTPEHELATHPGKAAAQAAHAAQVAFMRLNQLARTEWRAQGYPLAVIWPNADDFSALDAEIEIRDAGFTVVPSGTLTAKATWC